MRVFGRLDVPERRVERGVERVDDLRHRRPRVLAAHTAAAARTCAAPTAPRSGARAPCAAAPRRRAARSRAAAPSQPGATTPTRVSVARLRISAVIGISLEQRRPHLRAVEVLRLDRLARQAGTRATSFAVSAARPCARPAPRAKPSTIARQAGPSSPPRTIHSNSGACSGVSAIRAVRQAQEVAVAHALALAVLDRLVGELAPACWSRVPRARCRGAASGPSRGSPRRSGRTRTGACRCGRPAAARRARPGASRPRWRRPPSRARRSPGRSWPRGPHG